MVTKYFYVNYNYYGLSSRPNNSLATRNAKTKYFYQIYLYYEIYILKLQHIYLNYVITNFTVNTLILSPRTLLVLSNYLNLKIFYLHLQITPQLPTYPKVTLYNPVTQQQVWLTWIITIVSRTTPFVRSTSANFHESLREEHTISERLSLVCRRELWGDLDPGENSAINTKISRFFYREMLKRKLFSENTVPAANNCSLKTKHCG